MRIIITACIFLFISVSAVVSAYPQDSAKNNPPDNLGLKFSAEELSNVYPAGSIFDLFNTVPGLNNGSFRGGLRYETKILLDGMDMTGCFTESDKPFLKFPKNLNNRISRPWPLLLTGINANSIQSAYIRGGGGGAEYSGYSAGIIDLKTKSAGSKYTGNLYFRISKGGLKHKGPDIYETKKEWYFQERADRLEHPFLWPTGKKYTWTEDKYSYGEKPVTETGLSFGGPVPHLKNAGFYFTSGFFNSYGRFPNEFNRNITSSLKLDYSPFKSHKFISGIFIDDGGILSGFKNRYFNKWNMFALEGAPQYESLGLTGHFSWSYNSGNNKKFNLFYSRSQKQTNSGFCVDNGNGIVESGEDGEFIVIDINDQLYKYFGPDLESGFFYDFGSDGPYWTMQNAGNSLYYGGWYYFEKFKRSASTIKGNYSFSPHSNHTVELGFEYKKSAIDNQMKRSASRSFADFDFPITSTDYKVHPKETGIYIQDRIKLKNTTINAGLRYDRWKPGGRQFSEIYYPAKESANETGVKTLEEVRDQETKTYTYISPRLSVYQQAAEKLNVFLIVGSYFQTPLMSNLYDYYGSLADYSSISDRAYASRNVNWKPLKSASYEM